MSGVAVAGLLGIGVIGILGEAIILIKPQPEGSMLNQQIIKQSSSDLERILASRRLTIR